MRASRSSGRETDERREPQSGEGLERLAPADRAAELCREQTRPLGRVVVHVGVDVGDDAHLGREERHLGQGLAEVGARSPHQGSVERPGDLNRQHTLRSQRPGELAGQGHGVGSAGDDDLARRVVVGHPHVALRPHASGFGVVVSDAEQGGHRSRRLLPGASHGLAPSDDEPDPVLEAEGTAGHERGVLTEAVAGARSRCETDPFDRVEDDETEDGGGQLRVLGLGQLLNRRFQEES